MTRSWRRATVVACLLTATLVALALVSLDAEHLRIRRVDLPSEIGQCISDADCVVVDKIGCCPCKAGGARWAFNKDHSEPLRKFLKRTCRRFAACMRVDTCREDLLPACVGGHCVARVANG